MTSGSTGRILRDERGLVKGLILQLAVAFALLGVLGYEGGQIVVAQVKAHSAARGAAQAAANNYSVTENAAEARAAAEAAAQEVWEGATITEFDVDTDGAATVTVQVTAKTFVVRRISAIEDYGQQHGTEQATPQR